MTDINVQKRKEMNATMYLASQQMKQSILTSLPDSSSLTIYHISNSLTGKKAGYGLARNYNPHVCNGLTIALVQHKSDEVELFATVCSTEDVFTRLEGTNEVLGRVHSQYNSGASKGTYAPLILQAANILPKNVPLTDANLARAAINFYIEKYVNSKAKPKVKPFAPTRAQVLNAEQTFVDFLKTSTIGAIDFRLIYRHQGDTTTVKATVAKTAHNASLDPDYLKEVEEVFNDLEGKTVRYYADAENRLTARWFAVKRLSKTLRRQRPQETLDGTADE